MATIVFFANVRRIEFMNNIRRRVYFARARVVYAYTCWTERNAHAEEEHSIQIICSIRFLGFAFEYWFWTSVWMCASVNDVNCYPQISLQIKNDHFVFDRLCLRWNDNTISFQCLLLHIWHCWSTVMNLAQAYSMSHYLMFVDVFEFVSLSCARFSIPSRKIWVSILFPHVIILTTIETHTHTRTLTLENHAI